MIKYIILTSILITFGQCARILVILPSTFYSHQLPLKQIYKELSLRGHSVVAITTSPFNNKNLTNLTEIDIGSIGVHVRNITFAKLFAKRSIYTNISDFLKSLGDFAEEILADSRVRKLLNDGKEYFDLVIVEWCSHPVFAAISQRFKCPLIGVRSMELRPMCHEAIGNPINPAYIPTGTKDVWSGFWGRLDNLLVYFAHVLLHKLVMLPQARNVLEKYVQSYDFDVENAESNVSVVIANTHPIFNGVRPIVPTYIQIPGLHIHVSGETKLPDDIAQFLDSAFDGAIYLSFGSVIHIRDLEGNQLITLVNALSSLPYKILCKLDDTNFINTSENIKIVKWVPQSAVLAHTNVKLFITHGGLLSYQEAIHYKVPLVGFPFFGDQFVNVNRMVELNIGKRLDFYSLTERTAVSVIKEVIENPMYSERISTISDAIRDQRKMLPMDETIWWIEHVLKYNGIFYMRNSAVNLNILTYLLLDVIAFIIACAAVIIVFTLKITNLLRISFTIFFQKKRKLKREYE